MTGCSGYVTFETKKTKAKIVVAFSNPFSGTNKIGVGNSSKSRKVWDDMDDHYSYPKTASLSDRIRAKFKNSGGEPHVADVVISGGYN